MSSWQSSPNDRLPSSLCSPRRKRALWLNPSSARRLSVVLMAMVLGWAVLTPSSAQACGGFFCSQVPVEQTAERILFAVDDGVVTTHVQIKFQGSAQDFSWVVPTPQIPELFISSDALFQQLSWRTAPNFSLNWKEEGTCSGWPGCRGGLCLDDAAGPTASTDGSAERGVEVVSREEIGPYKTVILRAESTDALITWLNDNEYIVPAEMGPALDPYIHEQGYFVALRLQNDKDTGDLAPLGMRFAGTTPSIPIRLTSLAASPDMRLEVYLLGDARAVPQNYLHVVINEAAIDWIGGGRNYSDVVTQAANEAGGHAFATDFSGPTEDFRSMFNTDSFDTAALRRQPDAAEFVNLLLRQGFPRNTVLQSLLRKHIPMPQAAIDNDISEREFYGCLGCERIRPYLKGFVLNSDALVDELQIMVIAPLEAAEQLFVDHASLTRLSSSVSPEEMTVDPAFVFNPDMADVSNRHEADLVFECGEGLTYDEAPRRIVLQDGTEIDLPPRQWFVDNSTTEEKFLDDLATPAALIVEQTSASGSPIVQRDLRLDVNRRVNQNNKRVRDIDAGSCSATGSGLWALGLGVVGLLRRRRQKTGQS